MKAISSFVQWLPEPATDPELVRSALLSIRSHFGSSELTTYLLTHLPSFFFSLVVVVVVVVVGVELL